MPSRRGQISAEKAESYLVLPGRADAGLLLLCDHAGNAFPPGYGTLGLPADQLNRHIAYDIGAAEVTRRLSTTLGVPAVMTRYSRLLIDPNRGLDDPTLIMRLSDGAIVPGNRTVSTEERQERIRRYHEPYHRAVDAVIDACLAADSAPAILSIHSFTESWKGVPRPWHVGVLWDNDARLAGPLLDALYADSELIVGENQPYTGRLREDTMWQHGTLRALPNVLLEIRQDLIRDLQGQHVWADRLAGLMRSLLDRPDLQLKVRRRASRADGRTTTSEDQPMGTIDDKTRTQLEAAVFRRLVAHLRQRTEVQNIDLMNLAGFCRNCLANWYQEAAKGAGLELGKDEAREIVYGMPYKEWQAKHQKDASPEQKAAFEQVKPHQH